MECRHFHHCPLPDCIGPVFMFFFGTIKEESENLSQAAPDTVGCLHSAWYGRGRNERGSIEGGEMFSTMHNQKRAEELIEDAKELIASIDETFINARERLKKKISEIDTTRLRLIKQTLAKFRERFETIENENPIELTPVSERALAEQLQSLYEKADIEPVEIKEVRRGKGGAFFASLIAVVVMAAAALIIGAVGTGQPLAPETFMDISRLEKILTWLSGGAFDPQMGSPLFGAVGLGIAVIAVWMITWSIMMGKAARRNLAIAEEVHAEAEKYHQKKAHYTDAIGRLLEELDALENILYTCDIYMQEFNAILQRIIHTEGRDFEAYKNSSKDIVKRAAECEESLVPLLNIAIVTSEGTPSKQLSMAISNGERLVLALIEERPIPAPEELVSVSEEAPTMPEYEKPEEEKESLKIETTDASQKIV